MSQIKSYLDKASLQSALLQASRASQPSPTIIEVGSPTTLSSVSAANGDTAYSTTRKSYFSYDSTSTATVDNVRTFAAKGGVGRWTRFQNVQGSWASVGSWRVNATTGDDDNDGTISPLKTMAELGQRINGVELNPVLPALTPITIAVETDVDPVDLDIITAIQSDQSAGISVAITGTTTVARSGTATASTNINPATGTFAQITDPSVVTWEVGSLIQSGTVYAWVVEDLGGGTAILGAPSDGTIFAANFPAAPFAYNVLTLPSARIARLKINLADNRGIFQADRIRFFGAAGSGGFAAPVGRNLMRFDRVHWDTLLINPSGVASSSLTNVLMANCQFSSSAVIQGLGYNADSDKHTFRGGVFRNTSLFLTGGAQALFDVNQVVFSSSATATTSPISMTVGASLSLGASGAGFRNSVPDCIAIGPACAVGLESSAGANTLFWGSTGNAGVGVKIRQGGLLTYRTGSTPSVSGAGGDFRCGNTALALTTINTTVSPTTTNTANQTWANLVAAIGAPGFGGSILNPINGAVISPQV